MVRIRVDESHIPHPALGVALRFAASCIKADAGVVPLAAEALADLIAADPLWPAPADYPAVLANGTNALVEHYAGRMHAAFAAKRPAEADALAQRISAINNPYIASLSDIETCRRATADLTLAGRLADAIGRVHGQY
ncbi:MAG: hypothetical protein VW338_01930 [Rhodospirillaceae bacterium]